MELQLVQKLVPLPSAEIQEKVINTFNRSDYQRNYELLKEWFELETTQNVCDENYQNQIHVFLRGAKNDLERAKTRLKNFFLNKEDDKFPEFYQFYDLSGKYLQFKNYFCLCLPGVTPDGYRLSCVGLSSSNLEHFDVDVMFKTIFMTDHLGMCLGHPHFIGVIAIIDCRYATTRHALKILSWTFRKYAKFQKEVVAFRLPKFYLINVPKYIEKFVLIGRAFMSAKLRSRFSIEQGEKEMRLQIPKEYLPSDYGGHGESIAVQTKKCFDLLMAMRPWYEAEFRVRLRPQNAQNAPEKNENCTQSAKDKSKTCESSTTAARNTKTSCKSDSDSFICDDFSNFGENLEENDENQLLIVRNSFNSLENEDNLRNFDEFDRTEVKFKFGELNID